MFIIVLSFSVAIVAYADKSTSAQTSPVAVDESALRKYPFVPTVNLPTVSTPVPASMSPLASNNVGLRTLARSKAVKVIISRISPAVKAAREAILEPSVAT